MSETTRAVAWLRDQLGSNSRQRAMFERLAQLILAQDAQLKELRRRDADMSNEIMEQRARINGMRAMLDPEWSTEG